MAQSTPDDWPTQATEWYSHHEAVVERVARQWPGVQRAAIHDAFVDALLQLGKKPDCFDPRRGELVTFLAGATARLVRDAHRSETARKKREKKTGLALVAARQLSARQVMDEIADQEAAEHVRECLERARGYAARTEEEQRYLVLWEAGVSDGEEVVRALGIERLSAAEQQVEIIRTRKRLMKRLERFRDDLPTEETAP